MDEIWFSNPKFTSFFNYFFFVAVFEIQESVLKPCILHFESHYSKFLNCEQNESTVVQFK